MATKKVYRVELRCTFNEWWRYNVQMQCGAFDEHNERIGFTATEQTIAEVGASLQVAPDKGSYRRTLVLESAACHHARFLIYIMPHTLPSESRLEHTPPFEISLRIACNGKEQRNEQLKVNQWSGTSIERMLD